MTASLPAHPDLDQLRKQAKDLLKAHKHGDATACQTLRLLHRFANASDQDIFAAGVALHEAQQAVALRYGYRGWRELLVRVQGVMRQEEMLRTQYKDPSNLQTRSGLHGRFQTNRYGWLRWIFDHFDLAAGARILDVGCGDGGLWVSQRARIGPGWHLTLADMSPGMIAEAQRRLVDPPCDVRFAVADAQNLPFDDHSFDAVVANHMLYHVADLDRGLGEIRRVLRPAGTFYASTNGLDGMREIRDMIRPFAPDLPFTTGQTARAFGLENGRDLLARHFECIELHRYPDSLEVTETEPLLAYILSVRGAGEALSAAALADLRRQIDDRIASAGSFRITKSHGMFVVRRSAAIGGAVANTQL